NYPADGSGSSWSPPPGLGIEEKFTVLYMGNAGRGHEFATALEAAQRLCDEAVAFLFIGGGPQWKGLKQSKKKLDLSNLHLLDYVPKEMTASVMTTADCALIVMRDDALGVISPSKLHGYLAMGLPVIYVGPEGSNVDEAIQRFGCGVSLRDGDVAGLVDTIQSIRSDPKRRKGLSDQARVAFNTGYSDAVSLPRFDRLLKQLSKLQ
ncbi:MAG: glycosyltransferase, partial [Anaerolineales bacterium]